MDIINNSDQWGPRHSYYMSRLQSIYGPKEPEPELPWRAGITPDYVPPNINHRTGYQPQPEVNTNWAPGYGYAAPVTPRNNFNQAPGNFGYVPRPGGNMNAPGQSTDYARKLRDLYSITR